MLSASPSKAPVWPGTPEVRVCLQGLGPGLEWRVCSEELAAPTWFGLRPVPGGSVLTWGHTGGALVVFAEHRRPSQSDPDFQSLANCSHPQTTPCLPPTQSSLTHRDISWPPICLRTGAMSWVSGGFLVMVTWAPWSFSGSSLPCMVCRKVHFFWKWKWKKFHFFWPPVLDVGGPTCMQRSGPACRVVNCGWLATQYPSPLSADYGGA